MLLTISSKYWMATRITVWRNIISEDQRPHAAESKSHYPRQFLERASHSRQKELLQIFYPWLGYGHKMILIHFIRSLWQSQESITMGDGDDIDSIKEGVNYCCPNGAGCLHQRDYGFDKEVSYLELSQASRIRTRLRWKVLDNEGDIPSNRTTKNSQSQFPSVEW